jgi:hypothetical protein
MAKGRRKFDIDEFVGLVAAGYKDWNPPIITFIANRGATPFEILVSTILSLRTKDEVTAEAARRLFREARTPDRILALGEQRLSELIYPVGFYPTKARRLMEIWFWWKVSRSRRYAWTPMCIASATASGMCKPKHRTRRRWLCAGSCPANIGSATMNCWWLSGRWFAVRCRPFAASARRR